MITHLNESGIDQATIQDAVDSGISWEELCEFVPRLVSKSFSDKVVNSSSIRACLKKYKENKMMESLTNPKY